MEVAALKQKVVDEMMIDIRKSVEEVFDQKVHYIFYLFLT